MEEYHIPVLMSETLTGLNLRENGIVADLTLGGGGHTRAILEAVDSVRVIGFDQDPDAIARNREWVARYEGRLTLVHDNFVNMRTRLSLERIRLVDGILLDLGVSSHQLDETSRGFSWSGDAPLDMRMNPETEISALDLVNTLAVGELTRIIREYGEEHEAWGIAKALDKARAIKPIATTGELAALIDRATRSHVKHKAKSRVFQALRIHVNRELEMLSEVLEDCVSVLAPEGRLVVIAYHSLEDRIVKQFIQKEIRGCVCPPAFPMCTCGRSPRLIGITRKPIQPGESEIDANPRSRSARLRIAERTGR